MYSVKNYRNYLPGLGLIITFILARIWDYNDYLILNYEWVIFLVLLLNPIVFGTISIILNTLNYNCRKKYTESTFAILIQLFLYPCGLLFCDLKGIVLFTLYFVYILIVEFLLLLFSYIFQNFNKCKKGLIFSVLIIVVIAVGFNIYNKDNKDEKEIIFEYVTENKNLILDAIAEINKLDTNLISDDKERIVYVGNSETNEYAVGVSGLYVGIEGFLEDRNVETENGILLNVLNGNPVKGIGIDNAVVIFDCGGKGIVPSTIDYYFYYSPTDEPYGVFGGKTICKPSEMKKEGKGYLYTDKGHNTFYTEKITDNFYYCEAAF